MANFIKNPLKIGTVIGKWTLISYPDEGKKHLGLFSCECGTERILPVCTIGVNSSCCGGRCMTRAATEPKIPVGRARDFTGLRFGKLVAIHRVKNIGRDLRWQCICDCGKKIITNPANLLTGASKSCGCARMSLRAKTIKELKNEKDN